MAWRLYKRIARGSSKQKSADALGSSEDVAFAQLRYVLRAGSVENRSLVDMPETTTRLITYDDELRAARARQRIWIRYEDRAGNTTERKIEIYHPEDDEYLFAWCCSKLEPRTFARRSIRSWRLLPERGEFDPVVEQYWREEGTRDQAEKLPWRRWLQNQPRSIGDRYERQIQDLTLAGSLATGETTTSMTQRPPASDSGPRWWELRDEALLKYSQINGSSLAEYTDVLQLIERAIAGGASVSAQARLYRVLGEIHHHCGNIPQAIDYLERAVKLDPGIGIKKLLMRLKAEPGQS